MRETVVGRSMKGIKMKSLEEIAHITNRLVYHQYLKDVFTVALEQGQAVIAVQKKPGLVGFLLSRKQAVFSSLRLIIYYCDNPDDFQIFYNRINCMPLLFYTNCYFLVAQPELKNEIMRMDNIARLRDARNLKFVVKNESLVHGIIEWIDNELHIHGDNVMKALVSMISEKPDGMNAPPIEEDGKTSTYRRIEKISKLCCILFAWGCWLIVILYKHYWLLIISLMPYVIIHNYFVTGVLHDKLTKRD